MKIAINTLNFVKVIINVIIKYHSLLNLIIIDKNLLLTSNF